MGKFCRLSVLFPSIRSAFFFFFALLAHRSDISPKTNSMNLARRELAIVLATIFRRYDGYHGQEGRTLELYDTERKRDIDANHDMIIPAPAKGSKGVRMRVRQ